jgi:hypothetical protein
VAAQRRRRPRAALRRGLRARPAPTPQAGTRPRIWHAALAVTEIRCIYDGATIEFDSFDLDHFLPRAFVAHDRFWNLTPIPPQLNGLKRDHLPDLVFLDGIAAQHAALARIAEGFEDGPARAWSKALDQYAQDLRIPPTVLKDRDALAAVYRDAVMPLASVARRMGFPEGWRP